MIASFNKIGMTRYGIGTLILLLLFPLIFSIGAWLTGKQILLICSIICWILFFYSCYFFRDPVRRIPADEDLLVSPADGKVIDIVEKIEHHFFDQKVTRVSIFLSIFDVHVNRIPMSGKVTYFDYQRGKFLPAFKDAASVENEHTAIGIESANGKIYFNQIAGFIARRIVCDLRIGHTVVKGDRFGMIKFGSRIDIFLPQSIEILVALNQRVKGGETEIGKFDKKQ